VTFAIRGRAVDGVNHAEQDEGAEQVVHGRPPERYGLTRRFAQRFGLPKRLGRFSGFASLGVCLAQILSYIGTGGVQLAGLLQRDDRGIGLLQLHLGQTELLIRFRVLRVERDGFLAGLYGLILAA